MAGIRRPPREPSTKRAKPVKFIPIHQQILGKAQIELDTIEDLRYRLEVVYDRDEMDYAVYLDCHEALDVREAKAKIALDKCTGRYVKPDKVVPIKVKVESRHEPEPWKPWQVKLFFVAALLILLKIYSLGG